MIRKFRKRPDIVCEIWYAMTSIIINRESYFTIVASTLRIEFKRTVRRTFGEYHTVQESNCLPTNIGTFIPVLPNHMSERADP